MELVSSFPHPPPYYRRYGADAVAGGRAPPPPPVIAGQYSMFGTTRTTEEKLMLSLEDQGLERLYPNGDNFDRIRELKRLNTSVVFNFMELLDCLVRAPEQCREKLQDLERLFVNMHHLVNEYRPHQARETIRAMLDLQRVRRSGFLADLQREYASIDEIVRRCAESLHAPCDAADAAGGGAPGGEAAPSNSSAKDAVESALREFGTLSSDDWDALLYAGCSPRALS